MRATGEDENSIWPCLRLPELAAVCKATEYDRVDNDKFNMSMRKFLKQVGVTSQQAIEAAVREKKLDDVKSLKVRMVLTSENADLEHVVEGDIDLG